VARALDGLRIAVTRADGRSGPLADALAAEGAEVVDIPLTRIEALDPAPLAEAVAHWEQYRWVILTSVNAVRFLADALQAQGRYSLSPCQLAVVGRATADAALAAGWTVTVMPERFVAEAVLDALAARSDIEGARVLYPAAAGARDVLPAGLRALGATVDLVPVYHSAPDHAGQDRLRALAVRGGIDLVTVAAPSAVDALQDALPPEHARRMPVACIGPVTARAARMAGFPVAVEADSATPAALVRSIVAVRRRGGLPGAVE
jgi:uroporphyrinogen-III synthase